MLSNLIPWNRSKQLSRSESEPVVALRNEINRLFDDFITDPFSTDWFEKFNEPLQAFSPRVDVSETDKEVTISMELPGMDEKDIEITVSNDAINISGKKEMERTDKGRDYYRQERSYGSFQRSIPLRGRVDQDKVEASFDKGVLKITAPRLAASLPDTRRIQVKKA